MSINQETVERMAALSKLHLTQEEVQQLSCELETIVNYMDILSQLPCEQAERPSLLHNVLREDRAICSPDRAALLSNAPETDGESLVVPKTVG